MTKKRDALPPRVRALAEQANEAIRALPGVSETKRDSYRVGGKVFVRIEYDDDAVRYGFKLLKEDAAAACDASPSVAPMRFGGMGAKGWVEVTLRRKTDLQRLRKLVARSRALF